MADGLLQHQALDALGAAVFVVALYYDGAEADVSSGGFEAGGHSGEETLDD